MIKDSLRDCCERANFDTYIKESMVECTREDLNSHLILNRRESNVTTESKKPHYDNYFQIKQRDVYFGIRILQINIVTITFVVCDIYQTFYCISKMLLMGDHFKNTELKVIPLTKEGSYLYFLHNLSIILPIFTNFIAFYFLIRNSYKIRRESFTLNQNSIDEKDINTYTSRHHTNLDIESFLN